MPRAQTARTCSVRLRSANSVIAILSVRCHRRRQLRQQLQLCAVHQVEIEVSSGADSIAGDIKSEFTTVQTKHDIYFLDQTDLEARISIDTGYHNG